MILSRGRSGQPAESKTEQYSKGVLIDNILKVESPQQLRFDSVFYPPKTRTTWHSHREGEVLIVTSGQGRVASKNGERSVVRVGDAVYFAPGEIHWQGAGPTTFWHYLARSAGEAVDGEPVDDKEYLNRF